MKKSTFLFLEELAADNNKVWFERNRIRYSEAAEDFSRFFDSLYSEIAGFDRGVAEAMEAGKKIFRIYRDVRFSRDKSPYKVYLSGEIVPGGMHELEPTALRRVRTRFPQGLKSSRRLSAARILKRSSVSSGAMPLNRYRKDSIHRIRRHNT